MIVIEEGRVFSPEAFVDRGSLNHRVDEPQKSGLLGGPAIGGNAKTSACLSGDGVQYPIALEVDRVIGVPNVRSGNWRLSPSSGALDDNAARPVLESCRDGDYRSR